MQCTRGGSKLSALMIVWHAISIIDVIISMIPVVTYSVENFLLKHRQYYDVMTSVDGLYVCGFYRSVNQKP